MNMRRLVGIGCFVAALAMLSVPIIAQDKKPQKPEAMGEKPAAADEKAGGQPDMGKMMEDMKKTATPGMNHEYLKSLAGDWDIAGKFRMSADDKWQESKSRSHAEFILGDRFLTQKIKGDPMPGAESAGPFEGFGILGYDNDKKKFESV